MERIPITAEGLEKLKAELNHLQKVERPGNIRAIEEARAHGDISENAEYHAAKERQSFLDGKINELMSVIGKSEVIVFEDGPADRVVFGRSVLLYNLDTEEEIRYQLLGPYESEPEKAICGGCANLGPPCLDKEQFDDMMCYMDPCVVCEITKD